jgi:hypothetical protein
LRDDIAFYKHREQIAVLPKLFKIYVKKFILGLNDGSIFHFSELLML